MTSCIAYNFLQLLNSRNNYFMCQSSAYSFKIYLFYLYILEYYSKSAYESDQNAEKHNHAISYCQFSSKQCQAKVWPQVSNMLTRNIIEVTEQQQSKSHPCEQEPIRNQSQVQQLKTSPHVGRFRRFMTCLSNLWMFICPNEERFELRTSHNEVAKMISRLQKNKNHYKSVLPPQKESKKVLVLDLDETLIYTTFTKTENYDFQTEITLGGIVKTVYTKKRFGLDAFLFQMSQLYEIILFTASQRFYADKIIDQIDPKNRISHRLYRQNCIILNKTFYLKNLSLLGRNLRETIIVDDNNLSEIFQPLNFYEIKPFHGNKKDRHLCRLSAFLKHIHQKKEILPIKFQKKLFEQMEIKFQAQEAGQVQLLHENEDLPASQYQKNGRLRKANSEMQQLISDGNQISTDAQTTGTDLNKKL